MKCIAAASVLMATASAAETNPLSKVLDLLDTLTAKIVKDGESESKAYSEFADWCKDAQRSAREDIATATTRSEKLKASINKQAGTIEACTAKIAELAASIASDESDLKSATQIRAKEATDFAGNEAELLDVISSLSRALSILEREAAKNPAALAQIDTSSLDSALSSLGAVVDAASFSTADRQKLLALVQSRETDADDDEPGAPAASVYKSHSGGILDVIADLKEKAETQLSNLRSGETNARHNFEMLKQSLEDQMQADTKAKDGESAAQSAAAEAKATAEGDLQGTEADLANAKQSLATASRDCEQTGADHKASQAARNEELKVIAEAKKVLQSSTGGAEGRTYSLVQVTMRTGADLAGREVVAAVKRLAKTQHSATLAQLASRIGAVLKYGSSRQDPFAKVRGLIEDMIGKLEQEASSEATEKAYCDEQLSKTNAKKAELTEDIAKVSSKIESASARSAGLKEDVKELQAELAQLAEAQAKMDQIRREEQAAYKEAKADLEAGLEGVRQALRTLRDYYGSSASSALLQSGASIMQPSALVTHEAASGAGQSITGLLEVVESDFSDNLAKVDNEEADAADEYAKTTQENKVTKSVKEKDAKYKTHEFVGLDKSIAELKADRDSTDDELSAVTEYLAKIQQRCIAKPETYQQRQQRRAAEINGLKEALAILNDETALVQRRKRGLRGHSLAAVE